MTPCQLSSGAITSSGQRDLLATLTELTREARCISFNVAGIEPAPQGSKRYVGKNRKGRAILIESCNRVTSWRQAVCDAAIAIDEPMIYGPVMVCADFRFLRPKGHYGTRGNLRSSAPRFHVVKPDGDKLLRSSLDAMTGALLRDDSQVFAGPPLKRYCLPGELPGALFTIYIFQ